MYQCMRFPDEECIIAEKEWLNTDRMKIEPTICLCCLLDRFFRSVTGSSYLNQFKEVAKEVSK